MSTSIETAIARKTGQSLLFANCKTKMNGAMLRVCYDQHDLVVMEYLNRFLLCYIIS